MKWEKRSRKVAELDWLTEAGEKIAEEETLSRRRLRRRCVVTAAVSLALALTELLAASGESLPELLLRPPYGSGAKEIYLEYELHSAGQSFSDRGFVDVQEEKPGEAEANALFDAAFGELRHLIPTDTVRGDLSLPESGAGGLVKLVWESSDPSRISPEGQVDLLDLPPVCAVRLRAVMTAGEYSRTEDFIVLLSDAGADLRPSLERRAGALLEELSGDDSGESLTLPRVYRGAELSWHAVNENSAGLILLAGAFLAAVFFFGRYDALEKHLAEKKAALEREVPGMVLQLILLLDAGLVLSSALDELIERNGESGEPLYAAMANIRARCLAQNLSFADEFRLFAGRSGCRDLIRISALIAQHASRGSELCEKLENEREQLWEARLENAREKAKQAETKLCLPLMLLLLAITALSVAPALMEM